MTAQRDNILSRLARLGGTPCRQPAARDTRRSAQRQSAARRQPAARRKSYAQRADELGSHRKFDGDDDYDDSDFPPLGNSHGGVWSDLDPVDDVQGSPELETDVAETIVRKLEDQKRFNNTLRTEYEEVLKRLAAVEQHCNGFMGALSKVFSDSEAFKERLAAVEQRSTEIDKRLLAAEEKSDKIDGVIGPAIKGLRTDLTDLNGFMNNFEQVPQSDNSAHVENNNFAAQMEKFMNSGKPMPSA